MVDPSGSEALQRRNLLSGNWSPRVGVSTTGPQVTLSQSCSLGLVSVKGTGSYGWGEGTKWSTASLPKRTQSRSCRIGPGPGQRVKANRPGC